MVNNNQLLILRTLSFSVVDPDDFGPDLDPTYENKPDPDPTHEKMRIWIRRYVKLWKSFL
jgi:hypothetical protein